MVNLGWRIYAIKSIAKLFERSYGKCPKCGGKLVVKKGKYGKFLGCNRYPRCTFTTDI